MSIGKLGLIKCGSNIQQCPTLAELTADATATASQIAEGATAYVQGEKITGTMPTTIDVAAAQIKFGYSSFEKVPSCFDFSALTNGSNMFTVCTGLTSLSGLNTPLLTNGTGMFNGCTGLTSLSGLNISSLTNALDMFKGCTALAHIHNDSTISCDLSFADSPLLDPGDAESYILGRLADLAGKATQTLTFNTALQSSISESAIQAATDKNWVVNFADSM